jgi:hypothetical protein
LSFYLRIFYNALYPKVEMQKYPSLKGILLQRAATGIGIGVSLRGLEICEEKVEKQRYLSQKMQRGKSIL